MIDEFGIYFLLFDRAGYGESDPHPSRTLKTDTYDIEEIADKLQIGPKFHVLGMSLGAYPVYGCLKYIPHRYIVYIINLLKVESKIRLSEVKTTVYLQKKLSLAYKIIYLVLTE